MDATTLAARSTTDINLIDLDVFIGFAEIGPKMLARLAKQTGLSRRTCDDLYRFVPKLPSAGRGKIQQNQVILPAGPNLPKTE